MTTPQTVLLRRAGFDGPVELVVKDGPETRVYDITYVTLLSLMAEGMRFLASKPEAFR